MDSNTPMEHTTGSASRPTSIHVHTRLATAGCRDDCQTGSPTSVAATSICLTRRTESLAHEPRRTESLAHERPTLIPSEISGWLQCCTAPSGMQPWPHMDASGAMARRACISSISIAMRSLGSNARAAAAQGCPGSWAPLTGIDASPGGAAHVADVRCVLSELPGSSAERGARAAQLAERSHCEPAKRSYWLRGVKARTSRLTHDPVDRREGLGRLRGSDWDTNERCKALN